jgi:hypothetical protein
VDNSHEDPHLSPYYEVYGPDDEVPEHHVKTGPPSPMPEDIPREHRETLQDGWRS